MARYLLILTLNAWSLLMQAQITPINTVAELSTRLGIDGAQVVVKYAVTDGDYGGGIFYWSAASTAVADGFMVIAVTGVATGRWLRNTNVIGRTAALEAQLAGQPVLSGVPTVTKGAAVGTGTATLVAGSTDSAGQISLTVATLSPASNVVFSLAFSKTLNPAPRSVIISPGLNTPGSEFIKLSLTSQTASGWSISCGNVALSAGNYIIDYTTNY